MEELIIKILVSSVKLYVLENFIAVYKSLINNKKRRILRRTPEGHRALFIKFGSQIPGWKSNVSYWSNVKKAIL